MRLLTLLRDLAPARSSGPGYVLSSFSARMELLRLSSDMQVPQPKKIPVEMVKEGAD